LQGKTVILPLSLLLPLVVATLLLLPLLQMIVRGSSPCIAPPARRGSYLMHRHPLLEGLLPCQLAISAVLTVLVMAFLATNPTKSFF